MYKGVNFLARHIIDDFVNSNCYLKIKGIGRIKDFQKIRIFLTQ